MSRRAEDEIVLGATLVAEPEVTADTGERHARPQLPATGDRATSDRPPANAPFGPRYEVQALLGVGGMGTVYRVLDLMLDEVVALKVLQHELADDPEILERFRREVKLARRVTHGSVARTYDIGEHEGVHFITMEYVDGEAITALLRRAGRFSCGQVAELTLAICAGLGAAHAAGVIHRDLKPDNVLVARDGRVVITDFGIACAYRPDHARREGQVLGTPLYMAPEQLDPGALHDARTDIFALGAMMFHMATGVAPSPGSSSVLVGRLRGELPDSNQLEALAPSLAPIVLRCMRPDPGARYGSVAELCAAIGAIDPSNAPPGLERASRWPSEVASPRRTTGVRSQEKKPVLVFPLQNRGSAEDGFLAAGLTEDLMDVLRSVRGLSLTLHAARMPESGADLCAIGRRIGMDVTVDGSVRRVGEDLRVVVRLHTTRDGLCFWSARFRAPLRELFELSEGVARAVAERLALPPGPTGRRPPTDAGAMDAYLRGRAALRNVWPTSLREALAHLGRARELAPRDPTILATFARATTRLWFWSGAERDGDAARSAARRAMELAPSNAEARLALAGVFFMRNQHGRALRMIEGALQASPGLAEPHELRGRILLELGDLEWGITELQTAASLDVRYDQPIELSRAFALLGRWREVEETLSAWRYAADEASARAVVCARLALWSPEPERITAFAPDFASVDDPGRDYVRLATALRAPGARLEEQGRATLVRYVDLARKSRRFALLIHQLSAEVYGFVGDREAALEHVERAARRGLLDLAWLDRCPLLQSLKGDARHERARARVVARVERAQSGVERPT